MTGSLAESLGGHSPDQWALDFLAAAHFPATPANVQVVVSWEYAESGGGGGMFNPLNTTQGGYAGETDFNSVGVKNYATYADGIAANARVIHNGYYAWVVNCFMQGNNAIVTAAAITSSPWGTHVIVLRGAPTSTPALPAQPAKVDEMQVIALPGVGHPAGRVPIAVWDPAHPNRITLENGARLHGDEATPIANVRTWTPKLANGSSAIPAGVTGIGIALLAGTGGQPDVVLAATGGNTYIALTT